MTPEADTTILPAVSVGEGAEGAVTAPVPTDPPPGNDGTEIVPPNPPGIAEFIAEQAAAPPPAEPPADQAEQPPKDAAGEGVYAPTVSIVELERDGVVVRRTFDPSNGHGIEDAFHELKEKLDLSRAGQPVPAPDPNLAARERAIATGHDLSGGAHACRKCGIAEWAALDGQPCNPREFDGGEPAAVIEAPADE